MDLETLLKLAGVQQSQTDCGCGDAPCGCSDASEPTGMSKFIAMVSPELLGQQPAMEADDEWGNAPDGAAGPAEYEDGIGNLGSASDTSLRRYLKARGANVTVDEEVYPDLTVESVAESYAAYTAEKAKNPYAIGMAAAMKSTGDKPPLKKSTITKAHKIAKGIDEAEDPQEATPGTYARVIYNYSEDFGMITLYQNGEQIDEWSGYFGADTVGNPLADEFVKIAKKNGLNPEGMNIVDDEGEKGTFKDNTFNWDQFANDATGTNEAEDEKSDVFKKYGTFTKSEWDKRQKERASKLNRAQIDKGGKPSRSGEWSTYSESSSINILKTLAGIK